MNHFIEVYKDGYLSVHTGSRNIGLAVAQYYQNLAKETAKANNRFMGDLSWLEGVDMEDYLYDVGIMQKFSTLNRQAIVNQICLHLGLRSELVVESIHNYTDLDNHILRKGAISAQKGEKLVIPLNMRDGLLVCIGKGNSLWNYSAPHGAGRLYSRTDARKSISLEEFEKSMEGIYTTCVNSSTLDESPMAYKDWQEIVRAVEPTVNIVQRLIPIYNFKAN